jgi:hypothetical protein
MPQGVERCAACLRDATHWVAWRDHCQRWVIRQEQVKRQVTRWCRWHATVQAVQHNARGIRP